MPVPYSHSYFEISLPLDKILLSYDEYLRGNDNLGGLKSVCNLSNRIDDYIISLKESDKGISFEPEVKKLLVEFSYMKDMCIKIQNKLDAAIIIRHLYKVRRLQQKINKAVPYDPLRTTIMDKYYRVPDSYFQEFKSEVSHFKGIMEYLSARNKSEIFVAYFYNPTNDALQKYYSVFDLYTQPLNEKIKDIAFDGVMKIGCFIIFCLLFWLLAYVMCK